MQHHFRISKLWSRHATFGVVDVFGTFNAIASKEILPGPRHAGFSVFSMIRTFFSLRKESIVAELQEDQEQQEVSLVISESICSSNERICPPNGIFGITKPRNINRTFIPSIIQGSQKQLIYVGLIFISFPNMFYTFPHSKLRSQRSNLLCPAGGLAESQRVWGLGEIVPWNFVKHWLMSIVLRYCGGYFVDELVFFGTKCSSFRAGFQFFNSWTGLYPGTNSTLRLAKTMETLEETQRQLRQRSIQVQGIRILWNFWKRLYLKNEFFVAPL